MLHTCHTFNAWEELNILNFVNKCIIEGFFTICCRRVTNDDFEHISLQIVELFPEECALTYYVPPVRKINSRADKSGVSKGRLVDKYRNKSTFIRAANKLTKESEALTLESENRESELTCLTTREVSFLQILFNVRYVFDSIHPISMMRLKIVTLL